MLFNSYLFILIYFPIIIIGYFLLNKLNMHYGNLFIIIGSCIFYIYGGLDIFCFLLVSVMVNWLFSIAIIPSSKCGRKKILLLLDIVLNITALFFFKYFNFFLGSINDFLDRGYSFIEIILPLGISFITFQQIMYVVNVYNNAIKDVKIVDYLLYILYFPKLLMGPLMEPAELIEQFNDKNRKTINFDNVCIGIKLFSFGLFKKMILADTFADAVGWGYSNIGDSTAMDWFLIMLFYTFEIYFDFSGYSDMAVGVSKILNIDLPINFDSPYKALSIRDFWKRWHISLTRFLTKYIYIPLGGSKKGILRTYINTIIVFLVSGIWHGANWTFIIWGLIHGLLSVFDRLFEKPKGKLNHIVKWYSTFFAVNILWLLFRSESIGQWLELIKKMFTFQDLSISKGLIESFVVPETTLIFNQLSLNSINLAVRGFSMLLFILFAYIICLIPENNYNKQTKNNVFTMITAAIAYAWSFLCLSSESLFVYFNF